jgi:hypothetical protein
LQAAGFAIDFVWLDAANRYTPPWTRLPDTLCQLARVWVQTTGAVNHGTVIRPLRQWLQWPLWFAYMLLPEPIKRKFRIWRRRLRPMTKSTVRTSAQNVSRVSLATNQDRMFLLETLQNSQPDAVIVNYAWLAGALDGVAEATGALTIVLTVDILHQRVAQFAASDIDHGLLDWTREMEAKQLRFAQVLLAIQEEDAAVLSQLAPDREVLCLPKASRTFQMQGAQVAGRCLFVGSNSDHNVHGLRWFLSQVWPGVLANQPQATLHVCGNVCLNVRGRWPGVRFLGPVDDLTCEYRAAQVCLVPLHVGSGLKIKLIEALGHGRASVCTSSALRGLAELADQAVLVADTPDQFATAVCALISESEHRVRMEAYALEFAANRLSPARAYQPLVDRLRAHIAAHVSAS